VAGHAIELGPAAEDEMEEVEVASHPHQVQDDSEVRDVFHVGVWCTALGIFEFVRETNFVPAPLLVS
jgi:hypothetical protein